MNILIVDDNKDSLYQLQTLLSGNGFTVVTASQGAEALEKARQSPPDVVVTDILMPVMDGFSLCRAWMQDERLKKIPLVFYTATYTDESDREFALKLGARRFIIKPEEPEAFVRAIREVIEQVKDSPPPAPAPVSNRLAVEDPGEAEANYLRQYNQVLVRKLEKKLVQVEQIRRQLEEDLEARRLAEKEILEQLEELRRWQQATLGREERVQELKREVNALLAAQNQPPRYPSVEGAGGEAAARPKE
jgi:CheY-like chemotaxis protein